MEQHNASSSHWGQNWKARFSICPKGQCRWSSASSTHTHRVSKTCTSCGTKTAVNRHSCRMYILLQSLCQDKGKCALEDTQNTFQYLPWLGAFRKVPSVSIFWTAFKFGYLHLCRKLDLPDSAHLAEAGLWGRKACTAHFETVTSTNNSNFHSHNWILQLLQVFREHS